MSAELEGLLLSMCEDMVVRRTDLLTVLETCELHHRASMLPPADRLIRQLVEDVYRNSVSGWMSGCCWLGFSFLEENGLFLTFYFVAVDCSNFVLDSLTWKVMSLQVDHVSMAENGSRLTDRSQLIRDRLHSKTCPICQI